jgi:micrococcal nuclease
LRRLPLLLLGGLAAIAQAETFQGKVIAVLDGDTVLMLRGNHPVKVRLADIDAPEKEQDFGAAARTALAQLVLHRQVAADSRSVDKYGRIVALLKVGTLNVNEEMVRQGMAWEYSNFHRDRHYLALQGEARQAKRGLWRQPAPLPPWQWRKQHVTGEAGRLWERPPAAQSVDGEKLQDDIGRRKQHAQEVDGPPVLKPGDYSCGSKHHCSQMRSCNEAHYYLTVCGVRALDPEGDGVPCKSLCLGGK